MTFREVLLSAKNTLLGSIAFRENYEHFAWSPQFSQHSFNFNFGDEIFPLIVEKILGFPVRRARQMGLSKRLLAGGSILHFARRGDVVWGAGVRSPHDLPLTKKIRLLAVRGPLTRNILKESKNLLCPEIYGDPALLLPLLYPDLKSAPTKGRIGLVPHYSDQSDFKKLPPETGIISPTRAPLPTIRDILSCELILSSSLHGLVVAEAFGIPARWVQSQTNESDFKYLDYYEGTGRSPKAARSWEEGLSWGGDQKITAFDSAKLLNAFPSDLKFEPAPLKF